MPRTKTQERITEARTLAAFAVLTIDDIKDELDAEQQFRRWQGSDLDELFERVEALEARLPTVEADLPEPEFVEGILGELDEPAYHRAVLAGAIELQSPVEFVYTNGDGETLVRVVSPYELKTVQDGRRFLLGYDHGRDGIRQFDTGKFESVVASTTAVEYRQPVS